MSGDALKALKTYRDNAVKGGRYGGQLLVDAVLEITKRLGFLSDWELERFTRLAAERGITVPEARKREEIFEHARKYKCRCNGDGFLEVGPAVFYPCGFCDASGEVCDE